VTLISLLIFICYAASTFFIFQHSIKSRKISRWVRLSPALIGLALQAILLNNVIYPNETVLNLGVFSAFCLISWLVTIQILISCLYRPLETLGIIIFPISGLSSIAAALAPISQTLSSSISPSMQAHILISMIAYSLITLSALHAITLAFQDHAIRSHHPGGFTRFLPPLHDMETLLFQMLGFGFIFLTIALGSGILFIDDLFAQHLVHKTALSILGWAVLAILLYGRHRFGWRGKVAIRWTLVSFTFIMLAYFGSKLVLEFLISN